MLTEILNGLYPPLLPLILAGIALRIRRREWTRGDSYLLGCWLGYFLLVLVQLLAGGGEISNRYFLIALPLALGWAGTALAAIWHSRRLRWLVPCIFLALVYEACRPALKSAFDKRRRAEAIMAIDMADVIRKDWSGGHLYAPPRQAHLYIAPLRPLIQTANDRHGYTGYLCGGTLWNNKFPNELQPDYRIFLDETVCEPYQEIWCRTEEKRTYRIGKRRQD